MHSLSIFITPGPRCSYHNKPDHTSPAEPTALTATSAADGCPQCAMALTLKDGVRPVSSGASNEAEASEETEKEDDQTDSKEKGNKGHTSSENHVGCRPKKGCREIWHDVRMKLWGIVESKYFNRGIMIAILINTISMGIEHHEQVHKYPLVWHYLSSTSWSPNLFS